jgi:hypothetical protein
MKSRKQPSKSVIIINFTLQLKKKLNQDIAYYEDYILDFEVALLRKKKGKQELWGQHFKSLLLFPSFSSLTSFGEEMAYGHKLSIRKGQKLELKIGA